MREKCISSGILEGSEQVFSTSGYLVGAVLVGGSIDSKAILYDSGDDDLSDKREIGFVSDKVPEFNKVVHANEGIYAELIDGAEIIVFFTGVF